MQFFNFFRCYVLYVVMASIISFSPTQMTILRGKSGIAEIVLAIILAIYNVELVFL